MIEYCECDISSPSAHSDRCINDGCSKKIKTIYEKYEELKASINAKHERTCTTCGYCCHMLDIPFMGDECPGCVTGEFKEITLVERLKIELETVREEALKINDKLNKVMEHHNNSIDLQLKIYEDLKADRDELRVENERLLESANNQIEHKNKWKEKYEKVSKANAMRALTMEILQEKIDSFGQSSSDLKAVFIGEFSWDTEEFDEDECEVMVKRIVPWTLQKQIFKEMSEYVRNRKDEDIRP